MKRAALYGETEIEFIPPDDEYVTKQISILLFKDGFTLDGTILSWKPLPESQIVPLLTTRELIQAGYDPSDGDLFKRILDGLKTAIIKGQVSNDVIQGQIVWVNEHF